MKKDMITVRTKEEFRHALNGREGEFVVEGTLVNSMDRRWNFYTYCVWIGIALIGIAVPLLFISLPASLFVFILGLDIIGVPSCYLVLSFFMELAFLCGNLGAMADYIIHYTEEVNADKTIHYTYEPQRKLRDLFKFEGLFIHKDK